MVFSFKLAEPRSINSDGIPTARGPAISHRGSSPTNKASEALTPSRSIASRNTGEAGFLQPTSRQKNAASIAGLRPRLSSSSYHNLAGLPHGVLEITATL